VCLLPGAIRTDAPVGETPLLKVIQTRDHLSMMSGVTPAGQLATMLRPRSMTGVDRIAFLRHLGWYFGCKLLALWDWASIHRAEEVNIFMDHGGSDHIHLEEFPAYAPDLNPDEGVWNHLKNRDSAGCHARHSPAGSRNWSESRHFVICRAGECTKPLRCLVKTG